MAQVAIVHGWLERQVYEALETAVLTRLLSQVVQGYPYPVPSIIVLHGNREGEKSA